MRPPFSGRGGSVLGEVGAVAAAVSDKAMPDRCVIMRAVEGGTIELDLTWVTNPQALVYFGPCRVQNAQPLPVRERVIVVGEERTTVRLYTVAIPTGATVNVADQLTVTQSGDQTLVDHRLRVTEVSHGSVQGQTTLMCQEEDVA